ncbi:MAG: YggT family protein [Phormidesmis sp.]
MASGIIATLFQGVYAFLQIYSILLIIRVLLTWFPNVDWSNPLLATLAQLTDPYLNLFRSIIPPIGGLDLSAILAFIALNLITSSIRAAGVAAAQAVYYSSLY